MFFSSLLVLPADDEAPFAALVVDEPPSIPLTQVPPPIIEIEVDDVVVRLAGDVSAGRVAEIAAALCGGR
jgi:hypothetical protein